MEAAKNVDVSIDPLKILVLEDEELTAQDLTYHIQKALGSDFFRYGSTTNLLRATQLVQDCECDMIVADLLVDETPTSNRKIDAQTLLKKIKREKLDISVVAHTAYGNRANDVKRNKLARYSIMKVPDDNTGIVGAVSEVAREKLDFRRSITNGISALNAASVAEDPIEKQEYLEECRQLLGHLQLPEDYPDNHRKLVRILVSFFMRLSSISSHELGLYSIGADLPPEIEKIRRQLMRPNFKYETILPVLASIEALGYPLLMRFDS